MRVRMTIYLAEATHIERTKAAIEGVNEGVNDLFSLIKENPGKRTPFFAQQLNTSVKNIERWLKHLKDKKRISFNGAHKTGGYFVIFDNS